MSRTRQCVENKFLLFSSIQTWKYQSCVKQPKRWQIKAQWHKDEVQWSTSRPHAVQVFQYAILSFRTAAPIPAETRNQRSESQLPAAESVIQSPGCCCWRPLFGQRPEHRVLVAPLAVLCVEVVLMDVVDHRVWKQVLDAEAPSQGPPHLGGTGLVPHPLPHQEDVPRVAREHVRLVHGSLGMKPPSADTDQAEAAGHLLHVLVQPQAGNFESVQEISPTQELQLGTWGAGRDAIGASVNNSSSKKMWGEEGKNDSNNNSTLKCFFFKAWTDCCWRHFDNKCFCQRASVFILHWKKSHRQSHYASSSRWWQ